jgi:hypothetical protein
MRFAMYARMSLAVIDDEHRRHVIALKPRAPASACQCTRTSAGHCLVDWFEQTLARESTISPGT